MATNRSDGRIRALLPLALTLVVACSGSEADTDAGPAGLSCPSGTVRIEETNDVAEPGAATREDAVRTELERLGLASSDQAISTGVIGSAPGADPGTERVQIPLSEGLPVTMTLTPLDPGWAVTASSRCAPE